MAYSVNMRVNSGAIAISVIPVASRRVILVHVRVTDNAEPDIKVGVKGSLLRPDCTTNGREMVGGKIPVDVVVLGEEALPLQCDIDSHLVFKLVAGCLFWVQVERHILTMVHDRRGEVVPDRSVIPLVLHLTIGAAFAGKRLATIVHSQRRLEFVEGLEIMHLHLVLGHDLGAG